MSNPSIEQLEDYHEKFYGEFQEYLQRVEAAFLDGEKLSGPDLHRGKHFLAHGMSGQFRAKQELLAKLEPASKSPRVEFLKRLHKRCVDLIRQLHDSVNRLSNPEVNDETRQKQPRKILRHLHKIDALLDIIFESEEEILSDEVMSELDARERDRFFETLNDALEQKKGCPRHS